MNIDQWALQQAADDALAGYIDLWQLKLSATHAPQRERVQRSAPGTASPSGDNDLTLNLEGILLGSAEQDDNPDIPIGLHAKTAAAIACTTAHGMPVVPSGASCCKLIKIYAYEIAENYQHAAELHDLLINQARYIGWFVDWQEERIHGTDRKKQEDIFLTEQSLQKALTMRGLEALPGTIRVWALRGHVATSRSQAGTRTYSLRDVVQRLTA